MKEILIWLFPFLLLAFTIGILSGCVGTHIYKRNISVIVGGISHFMIAPIGVSYALSFFLNTVISPIGVGLLASFIIAFVIPIDDKGKIKISQEMSIFWSFGMALGFFLAFLLPMYVNFDSFLFGNFLTVKLTEVVFIMVIMLFIVALEMIFYSRFKYLGIDDVFLQLQGIPIRRFHRLQLLIICIVVTIVLEKVGILMLIAIMTIPSAIAGLFTQKYSKLLLLSILISVLSLVLAVVVSYVFNLQLSSFIALILSVTYFILRSIIYKRTA